VRYLTTGPAVKGWVEDRFIGPQGGHLGMSYCSRASLSWLRRSLGYDVHAISRFAEGSKSAGPAAPLKCCGSRGGLSGDALGLKIGKRHELPLRNYKNHAKGDNLRRPSRPAGEIHCEEQLRPIWPRDAEARARICLWAIQ
jgi:hypothetical protein